ncbi:hypothetical protein [Kaistella faecalis]|uniref:hypothetical protein n=1 Tax=Kaistella faecalis TaxID=2852098 RepID=UPI001C461037|nr:hypothetical protein [Chryseobacterium faecale]UFK98665.1 hypothetical protein LL667_04725 [Chryseobacterium faecale]
MQQYSIFSYRKLSLKLLQFAFFLLTISIAAQAATPPIQGDYRSKITGNWTAASTWEVYSCSGGVCAWIPATTAPGVGTTSTAQGDYNVFITQGTEVTVNTSQTYYFGNLYILANNPVVNVYSSVSSGPNVGRINLESGPVELKLLGDQQNVYILGGVFYFKALNSSLGLRSGNSIIITDYNAVGTESGLGSNGLQQLGISCTGNQKIKFYNADGTLVESEYGVCIDSSSPYTFVQLNNYGGSLAAQLSLSTLKVCVGDILTPVNLTAGFTGIVPAGKTVNYELKLESGPAGYTFSPLIGSFTAPGDANSIPDPSLGPFALDGTYVYSLTVSYPYDNTPTSYQVVSTTTVTLEVSPAGSINCACYRDPVMDPVNKYPTKFGITALGRAGVFSSTTPDFWPEKAQGGHMALESQTKGFVINRVENTGAILIPVEGMMVFDLSDGQPKIYTLKAGDAAPAWHTFTTPTCPSL